jgi:hypothetical protein
MSKSDTEAYIRDSAIRHGIDPNIALAVARSEGLNKYSGDYGTSFGPYQLHYGGSGIPGMNTKGIGDAFTKDTGLDARDPSTVRQQIDYTMDQVRKGGWGPWHGAARSGIYGYAGVGKVPAASDASSPLLSLLGIGSAHAAEAMNLQRSAVGVNAGAAGPTTNNTASSQVNIGSMAFNTQATDAKGIAKDIKPALDRKFISTPANYGLWAVLLAIAGLSMVHGPIIHLLT